MEYSGIILKVLEAQFGEWIGVTLRVLWKYFGSTFGTTLGVVWVTLRVPIRFFGYYPVVTMGVPSRLGEYSGITLRDVTLVHIETCDVLSEYLVLNSL